jgi:hypothetical protein
MCSLERSFLSACRELVKAQQELVPLLALTLGVAPEDLFYCWMDRDFPNVALEPGEEWRLQVGRIQDTEWEYFFHGFECDLKNSEDGRFVRVEFGPRGRFDILSGYAVLQFVMTSGPPWPEFPDLKSHLADRPPPYNAFSGSHGRAVELWKRLEEQGLLAAAAQQVREDDFENRPFTRAHLATVPGRSGGPS